MNTKQQLADALTKGSLGAAIYVMLVAETAIFALKDDERLMEHVLTLSMEVGRWTSIL